MHCSIKFVSNGQEKSFAFSCIRPMCGRYIANSLLLGLCVDVILQILFYKAYVWTLYCKFSIIRPMCGRYIANSLLLGLCVNVILQIFFY